MIGADIDQIYGFAIILITDRGDRKKNRIIFRKELLFPTSTPFIPKEIYNITLINRIILADTIKKLVISNKIINLYNITQITVRDTPNVIISRRILRFALLDGFYYGNKIMGYKVTCRVFEDYEQIIIENTTILD